MIKEITICIIIILLLVIGDYLIQRYIKDVTNEVTYNMKEIKKLMEINKDNIDNSEIKEKFYSSNEEWRKDFYRLAFFIEHTELEKVDTSLTALNSFIETNEYKEANEKLNTTIFLLTHIEDKYRVNLQNIF